MGTTPEQMELPGQLPIERVFTPNNPIQTKDLLAGRLDLIWEAIDLINSSGMSRAIFA